MNKKSLVSVWFIFLMITKGSVVSGVELAITNDISDILNSKKICLHLSFGPNDQAVLYNSLSFSIDSPLITVASWTWNKNPSMQYVVGFKRVKKLYAESMGCELALNFDMVEKKSMLKHLSEASLYFSCIVLDKNGTSRPISLLKAIDDGFSIVDTMTLNNMLNFDLIKTFTADALSNKNNAEKLLKQPRQPAQLTENIVIDHLKDIWCELTNRLKNFFSSMNYIFWYTVILILTLGLLFKRAKQQTGLWETEARRLFVMLWLLWTYSFLSATIPSHIFFTIFAILLVPIAMYYIFTARTETTLDKLKSFIGFALAMSILPLLIKAFLMFMF